MDIYRFWRKSDNQQKAADKTGLEILDGKRKAEYKAGLEILKEQASVWLASDEEGLKTEFLVNTRSGQLDYLLMMRLNPQIITNRLNDRIVRMLSGINLRGMISRESLLTALNEMTMIICRLPICDDVIEVEAIRSKHYIYDVVINTRMRRIIQHSHVAEIPEILVKDLERRELAWKALADV